jgi:hypothetical protein
MSILILVFGIAIALVGLLGAVLPARFRQLLGGWQGNSRFLFAVIVRIVLGGVLLAAAPDLLFPRLLQILGGVSILAAIGLLLMGQVRLSGCFSFTSRSRVAPGCTRIRSVPIRPGH